ncbi:hypothetical protein [Congregibacter sp.]|uniref:hypothetical protein n=1 Tax=Congregibacter sp. TaxID=2744308 RepID=UPI00385D9F46
MLLRNITKHVKDQNWFAVSLDFIIVVFGILIAFQITEWNNARSDARSERALLERLHEEIVATRTLDAATRELFVDERQENLISARHVIFGVTERTELTDKECQAIGFSHLPLFGGRAEIPVISELRATGEAKLLRDEGIVRQVSKLASLVHSGAGFEESIRSKITLLSRAFPDVILLGVEPQAVTTTEFEVDPYDVHYECDTAGMRANAAFRNAFGENVTLQFSLVEMAIDPIRQSWSDLNAALDVSLGENYKKNER